MASQGITVSILAKIEGWQDLIKLIQNAMKNIRPGADISKGLSKDLLLVETMVNNLGKNMTQRLTSDSLITSFTDKIIEVELVFGRLGHTMQNISFGDLNPDYIANNFKSLLSEIEKAQTGLTTGFDASFLSAIAGSDRLLTIFSKLKIDPKDMNADELKATLSSTAESLEKELATANKELDKMYLKRRDLKQTNDDIKNSDFYKTNAKDITTSLLYGTQGPKLELNKDAITLYVLDAMALLDTMGPKILAKREEINQGLLGLLNASSIEEMRNRVDELRNIMQGTGEWKTFGLLLTQIEGTKDQFINAILPDELTITNAVTSIKERLVNVFNVNDESLLNNVGLTAEKFIKEGKWDQLPDELGKIINDALSKLNTKMTVNEGSIKNISADIQTLLSKVFTLGNLTADANLGIDLINNVIMQLVDAAIAPLRQRIAELESLLGTSSTAPFKDTAKALSDSSAKGILDATAAANLYSAALDRVKAGEQMVGKIQGVILRWFSVYAVVRMVTNSVKKAAKNIQELDSTMTEIAIVTKMDLGDLWAQMPKYTKMARDYASSIKGVYEVSLIYYQQGLEMNDVMSLTESTLKMARISGLDYSEAADYMTNAIRSFKMEMTDAERVVDVYSAVAASSASNVTELATAMSKTASSAQAVGSSFENTTAMLAVMIEATRESPENIGSAMKSIISRYGELKENKTGIDEEGEEYSLNKVDKALLTVGISIHDAKGEFRDFDDVIFELADHWNEIDKNTQRYIATVMAGNRQQSRFLALVSSSERLKEESAKATNSEDAAQLQFLKSLDSIDAKKQLLETSILSIYTNSGIENVYKGILDFTNNILVSFDNLSSSQGLGMAIAKIGATFMTLATLVTNAFSMIKARMAASLAEIVAKSAEAHAQQLALEEEALARQKGINEEKIADNKRTEELIAADQEATAARKKANLLKGLAKLRAKMAGVGMIASTLGLTATTYAASLDVNKDRGLKAGMTGLGGILSGIGTGVMLGGPVGAIMGVLTALPSIVEAIGMASETTEEKVSRLEKSIEETNNERIKSKDDLNSLVAYKKKYDELSKSLYESNEKLKEFKELLNEIAEKYPSLITSMDAEGNYLIDMGNAYELLTKAKRELYSTKFVENLGAELAGLLDIDYVLKNIYGVTPAKSRTFLGLDLDGMDKANLNFLKSFNERKQEGYQEQLVPRIDTGEIGTYGLKIYQYDSGFESFNARGLASLFLDNDASILSEGEDDSRGTAKYLLAGLYNTYIREAMQGTAYENIDIESTKKDLMAAAKAEYGKSTYSDISGNSEKYEDMLTEATTNFTANKYKSMMTTYQANEFSNTLRTNAILASNADYIKTLNASYEGALQNPLNSLALFAIKKLLDLGLDQYLLANEHLVKERKTYYDLASNSYKYWTTEKIVSDFYSDKQGDWYRKQSLDYDFLNNDKLLALYESLGSKTKKSIALMLGEDIGLAEVDTYSALELWLAKDGNRELLAGGEKSVEAAIKDLQTLPGLTNISADRLLLMVLTLKTFLDAWDELYKLTYDRYNSWADALGKPEKEGEKPQLSKAAAEKIQSFKDIFGPEYLSGIQDLYKTILKNASLSDSLRELLVQGLTDIFDLVASIETPEIKNAVLQKMLSADLTSVNGIYSLIEALGDIEDFDLEAGKGLDLKNTLKNFSKNLRVNVETEINSYFDTMESAAEGFDKALSSATSGMDLKAAKEMADKMTDKTLKDFTIKDGKFYFEDINALSDAYIIDAEERMLSLKENITSRYSEMLGEEGSNKGFADKTYYQFAMSEIDNGTKDLQELQEAGTETRESFEKLFNIDYNEFLTYYEKYQNQLDDENGIHGFLAFLEHDIDEETKDSVEAIKIWLELTKAISQLKNGKFNDFLTTALSGQDKYTAENAGLKILDAAMSGDFSSLQTEDADLYKLIEPYTESLINFFKDSKTSVLDSLIGMVGTDVDTTIKVTEANKEYLKQLADKGLVKLNGDNWDAAGASVESLVEDSTLLWSEIAANYSSEKDRIEAFKTLHKNKYSKNQVASLQAITDNEITYDEFLDYLINNGHETKLLFAEGGDDTLSSLADLYGLAMTATGDYIVENWGQYVTLLTDDLNTLLESDFTADGKAITILDRNAARAAVENARRGLQTAIQSASQDILSNYTDISVEQQEAFANALGRESDQLYSLYKTGIDGKTHLDVARFKFYSESFSEETLAVLAESFANIADDYLKNIKDAAAYVTSGTGSLADIVDFLAKARELGIDASDAFNYVMEDNAWMLDPDVMQEFVRALALQLVNTGMLTLEEVNDYVSKNTASALGEAIDIKSYLDSETRSEKEKDKLRRLIINAGITKKGVTFEQEDLSYYEELTENEFKNAFVTPELIQKKAKEALKKAKARNKKAREDSADAFMEALDLGGLQAVMAMLLVAQLTGEELTAADIESAYRAQVGKLEDAAEQLSYGIGSLISGDAVLILTDAGYDLTLLGDGNSAVINLVGDIATAYLKYYDALKETNDATLASLNEAYAKVLETKDGKDAEQKAIEALGDASSMTYTTLGAILSDAGMSLEDNLESLSDIIESTGGNKIRITDFAAFARRMGWDFNSEEYVSAFKSYNDGLIELNKNTEKSIADEVKGLEEIKPGEWLNLTKTEDSLKKISKKQSKEITEEITATMTEMGAPLYAIQDTLAATGELYYKLLENLKLYGAVLEDGILKLSEDANLFGVAKTLETAVLDSGLEMSDLLLDIVLNIITSYTDAITQAIEGGLTHEEMKNLITKGSDMGVSLTELDFYETAEGFLLATDKALSFYSLMTRVDSRQKSKIYSTLSSQLKASNKNYKTATSLLSHISDLLNDINDLKERNLEADNSQIEKLEEEIALAKELWMYSLTHEDESWNFLSTDTIPDSIDNALNYMANWLTAKTNLTTWAQNGKSDLDTFSSLLAHVEEVAIATGEAVEFMGTTVSEGAHEEFLDNISKVLTWDASSGSYKIDNSKLYKELGYNMTLGAKGITKLTESLIDEFTDLNAKALQEFNEFFDGLDSIYLSFNDYSDTDQGHTFEDFLDINGDFDYNKFINQLNKDEKALTAFNKFTEKIKINGQDYAEAMSSANGKFEKGTDQYKAILSIIAMAMSEGWDLESNFQTIADQMQLTGFEGEITLGDTTTIMVHSGNTIFKKVENGEDVFYDPYGGKHASLTEAQDSINQHTFEQYKKQFDTGTSTAANEFSINGQDIIVSYNLGKIIFKDREGTEIAEADDFNTAMKQTYDSLKEGKTSKKTYDTYEGWLINLENQKTKTPTFLQTGKVTAKARLTLLSKNLVTPDAISNAWNDAVKTVSEANNGIKIDSNNWDKYGQAVANEFQANTDILLDASDMHVTMDGNIAAAIASLVDMTQTANDVMTGLNAAFSAQGEGSVTHSISTAIQNALSKVSTGEDGAVEIKFLGVTKDIPPEIKDEKATVEYISTFTPPEIPVLHGTIEYSSVISDDSSEAKGNVSGGSNRTKMTGALRSKGTVGLAHAKSTLMGELGPEMVVSNNRYFVVGQNGPEFVNLADDAIVFNHLQTLSLLSKGTSSTRGKVITNEHNAVAYAKGSIHGGPARETRVTAGEKKRLYADGASNLWDDGTSIKSSSSNTSSSTNQNVFITTLEQWYNWLQKIAVLEHKITLEEEKRNKLSSSSVFSRSGSDYAESQVKTLKILQEEIKVQKALNEARQEEYERQLAYYNSSDNPWSKIYTFDDEGLIKYQDSAFEEFSKLLGSDKANNPNYTAAELYDYLVNTLGISEDYFKYDTSGKEIDTSKDNWESSAVSAFWSRIESDRDDMQTRYDDIQEGLQTVESKESEQNEILSEIQDNLIEVENKVLDALEESRQREIDELQDTRDAIEEANNKLIDGLTDLLDKERKLYEDLQTADELAKLLRQLAIALRSGGSAATIADLQEQIAEKLQDIYFDAQLDLIDALLEASDNELERLDHQIDIMQETLDYEKEYGLLWNSVNEILKGDSESIMEFIKGNSAEYWNKSSTELNKIISEDYFKIDLFKEYSDSTVGGLEKLIKMFGGDLGSEEEETEEGDEEKGQEGNQEASGGEKRKGTWKLDDTGWWYDYGNGEYEKNNWMQEDGIWYYFNDQGYAVTGRQKIDGTYYDFNNDAQLIGLSANLSDTTSSSGSGTKKKYSVRLTNNTTGATTYKEVEATSAYAAKVEAQRLNEGYTAATATEKKTKKASGGYVGHGLYELGEQGTETVLTAEQTNVLRHNILSNRPDSLISLLKSYNSAYKGLSSSAYDSIQNQNSTTTTIERAEINLLVENLADDYDSKRAASTIMNEMLRIASKTSANNSVRR